MTWKIAWRQDGYGLAVHGPTGAEFNISRTGWLAVSEAAGLSDENLSDLIAELRILLDKVSGSAAPPDNRLH